MTTNTPAAGEPSEREFRSWLKTEPWESGGISFNAFDGPSARLAWHARAALNTPNPSPSVMTNRERFETWCVSVHGYLAPPKWNDEENDYVGAEARMMWDVWNAAIIANALSPSEAHMKAAKDIEKFVPRYFSDDTLCPKCGGNAGVCPHSFAEMIAAIIANAQPGDRYAEGLENAAKWHESELAAWRVACDAAWVEYTPDRGLVMIDAHERAIIAIRAIGAKS